MWYLMAKEQRAYELSERLIRAITGWSFPEDMSDEDLEELIRQGAEVNRLHGTLRPLHCASMTGALDCLQLLLEHGAQVELPDGFGRSPIHYAAERNPDCLQVLLDNGANPNSPDPNMDTPLHWAAFKNNATCARILLQNGADVNMRDQNRDTPICWAAMKGNLDSILVLLDFNAQVDVSNRDGKSPLSRICTLIALGLDSVTDSRCLDVLFKAVGQFDMRDENEQFPNYICDDNRLNDMIVPLCRNPRSLQQLSRSSIRRELGTRYLPNVVSTLPIPHSLQEHVLLRS